MITLYCKDDCKYCTKAKDYLVEKSIPYNEVKLDPSSESYASQRDELVTKTNHKTFPFVFVGDTFVGGCDDMIRAYETLALHEMCERIGMQLMYDF